MMNRILRHGVALVAVTLVAFTLPTQATNLSRVSVGAAGVEANDTSSRPSVSADGRYVAFYSDAWNLVPGDGPPSSTGCPACTGVRDVFVRDRSTGTTVRVSVSSAGVPGNAKSDRPSISGDGRFVTFTSNADNLVPGDFNGQRDVFLHDRDVDVNGVFDEPGQISTTRVSVSSTGVEANGRSNIPVISADGRYIAFRSRATNLIAAGTNGLDQVFVHDRISGATVLVSLSSAGVMGNATSDRPSLSADGRYVAYFSDADNLVPGDLPTFDVTLCPACPGARDVFVHDRDPGGDGVFDQGDGVTTRVSVSSAGVPGNAASTRPQLSADGNLVEFKSLSDNLVPGDTNQADDVFVHDRSAGTTVRVSVASDLAEAVGFGPDSGRASLSYDGRYAAFFSDADNLVPGDTNGVTDVFVRDRVLNKTVRISVNATGVQGNGLSNRPVISADGRYVAFYSDASNLVIGDDPTFDPILCPACIGTRDIFVHDRDPDGNGIFDEGNQVIERVSVSTAGVPAASSCNRPSISADGRFVAFRSKAGNLVLNDTNALRDVFVHDRTLHTTVRVSVSSLGAQTVDGDSDLPSLSGDGRFVAFWSKASNLVPGDDPPFDSVTCPTCIGWADIFVRDRDPDLNGILDEGNGVTTRVSVSGSGVAGDGPSDRPWMAAGGTWVGFISEATNLVPGDTTGHTDVFVHNIVSGATVRVSVDSAGVAGNFGTDRVTLSADGRFVGMRSKADNLVAGDAPSFDTNGCPACVGVLDVFLHDRDPDNNGVFDESNGVTTRVSVNAVGDPGDLRTGGPKISGDGTVMAMVGPATNLVPNDLNYSEDVFIKDLGTGLVERANVSSTGAEAATPILVTPDSDDASMSADGRFVAFRSFAANLVTADTNAVADIFVHDRDTDQNGVFDEPGGVTTLRVSVNNNGLVSDLGSGSSRITADGSAVAFYSDATNLVTGDTNLARDVFLASIIPAECSSDLDCNDGSPCTQDSCNLLIGTCVFINPGAIPPTPDPSGVERSRYVSFVPGNANEMTALQVTVVSSSEFPAWNGTQRWVGLPHLYPEENVLIPNLTFVGAALQCEPVFHDWGTVDLLHVFGSEIMPDTSYEIRVINQNCGTVNDPTSFSSPLSVSTGKWGDAVDPFFGPGTELQPDFKDISGIVAKFLGTSSAPIKASAQLRPNVVFPNRSVNFKDIAADVGAFLGVAYADDVAILGPCTCPSVVTCGVTACTTDTPCGGGFCVDGFCADACGRCSP